MGLIMDQMVSVHNQTNKNGISIKSDKNYKKSIQSHVK